MTDFQKGQLVQFATETRAERAAGWGPARVFGAGAGATVTAVRKNTLTVKSGLYSYNVPRTSLRTPNGETWAAPPAKPKPRALGTPPEGEDVILPNDPRIAWFFADAAKLADKEGYCSYYDAISDRLGAPGRLRDITVTLTLNGISVRATAKARTTGEAEAIIRQKLTSGLESAKVDS